MSSLASVGKASVISSVPKLASPYAAAILTLTSACEGVAKGRHQLISTKGLLQHGGGFCDWSRKCAEPGDYHHSNTEIVQMVNQTKRHPISEFDVNNGELGS